MHPFQVAVSYEDVDCCLAEFGRGDHMYINSSSLTPERLDPVTHD